MVILQNTTDLQTFKLLTKSVVGEANIHPEKTCELGAVDVEITENGEYSVLPPEWSDGISHVDITIDVPDRYNEGFEDGEANQKSKLTSTTIVSNGEYTRENGWNNVIVNVPSEINNQNKTVNSSTTEQVVTADNGYSGLGQVTINPYTLDTKSVTYTQNGVNTITSDEDGLSSVQVTVNVDTQTPYDNGYTDGEAAQKAKMTSATFTTNNTYTRADGWNEVTVNVDTVTPYNNGYADGEADQKARMTDATFVENGTYSVENGYREVTVNVHPHLESKDANYTANGTYTINPSVGMDGISSASVRVAVPSDVHNQSKTANSSISQQIISPDQGYTGLDSVTINPYVLESKTVSYNRNDSYTITPSSGNDGISSVNVTVNVPSDVNNQNKTATITTNGTTTVEPDSQYSGLGRVTINTNVQPNLQSKTVTATKTQQTVTPDSNYYGLSQVTINGYTPSLQSKTVSSSTTTQTVTADNGYDGLQQVTVNPYTVEAKTESYTVNGTYTISPTNADAISGATITVNVPSSPVVPTQTKSASYTTNGSYTVLPDSGYNLSEVDITVDVDPDLEDITITQNGVYTSQNKDGFGEVTVSVSGGNDCVDWSLLGWDCQAVSDSGMLDDIANGANVFLPATTWSSDARSFGRSIPQLTYVGVIDSSRAQDIRGIFNGCSNLRGLPPMDLSNVNNTDEYAFSGCTNLRYIRGFNNLGKSYHAHKCIDLSDCPLTEQSVHTLISSIARPQDTSGSGQITLSSTCYAYLTNTEKSSATSKRWNIVSD